MQAKSGRGIIRGEPAGSHFFFMFAAEPRKVRFRPLRWTAKGSAFGIRNLLKKVDENFSFILLQFHGKSRKAAA
ncbi:MAG TPA: hypothetical protein IAC82_03510 [Candidatus Merdivicinus intestinigallinarum]|nr:hypothetical protein [Candidatus Merdivicinus intestinigallinarum]